MSKTLWSKLSIQLDGEWFEASKLPICSTASSNEQYQLYRQWLWWCEHFNWINKLKIFVMAINSKNGLNIVLICSYDTMSAGTREKVETKNSYFTCIYMTLKIKAFPLC